MSAIDEKAKSPATLSDGDIVTQPAMGRRSALLSVGAAVVASPTVAPAPAQAQGVNDSDPNDPPGRGRGRRGVRTGRTDGDSGSNADLAGQGRGPGIGVSDTDPNDPAGRGRGRRATGPTDADSGNGADPAGGGRGAQQRAPSGSQRRLPPLEAPRVTPEEPRAPQRSGGQPAEPAPRRRIADF